jgi:hypothetical protein
MEAQEAATVFPTGDRVEVLDPKRIPPIGRGLRMVTHWSSSV